MRVFNRVLATIIAIALIVGSAIGILYFVGLLADIPALTQLVRDLLLSLRQLNAGQVQAILLGTVILSLLLFVLEVRPWRQQYIPIRDDQYGRTQVPRVDIVRYLIQRLSRERGLTTESLDIVVHGGRFDVETSVAASTTADRQAIREDIERDIKDNLASIGMDKELERIDARVLRVKRAA